MRGVAALAVVLTACASTVPVERVYGGRSLHGRYVESGAYAAFLRGAIAEAGGDSRGALEAYKAAAELDSEGPEIWTRLGAVRCAADGRDRKADEAFARAVATDPTYGKAWEARAKCALARGDGAGSLAAAARAAELDASADEANAMLARSAGAGRDTATREALVALTLTSRAPVVAWDALSRWAESRGDVALWVKALQAVVRLDPARRDAVAQASERLAGTGAIAEARSLAAAAVGAGEQPLSEARHPLACRLAVDEAIFHGKAASVSVRASRARLSLEEAAGRALLLGKPDVARELASAIVRADPSALGASLVLAVAEGRDVLGAARGDRGDATVVSGAALVAFGAALWHVASAPQVRDALGRIAHDRIVDGDDAVIRPAVELVARGVLPRAALPADGLVELAAMGLGAPPPVRDEASLDVRHAYLALAVERPKDPRARELGVRLASVASSDPVVASAAALVALANDAPIRPDAATTLLSIDAADPLLAAIALRLAEKSGDRDAIRRAGLSLLPGSFGPDAAPRSP
jgi:tetratricopeptide (TPR) repeat protein